MEPETVLDKIVPLPHPTADRFLAPGRGRKQPWDRFWPCRACPGHLPPCTSGSPHTVRAAPHPAVLFGLQDQIQFFDGKRQVGERLMLQRRHSQPDHPVSSAPTPSLSTMASCSSLFGSACRFPAERSPGKYTGSHRPVSGRCRIFCAFW